MRVLSVTCWILSVSLMSACTHTPLQQSPRAMNTTSVNEMTADLKAIDESITTAQAEVPGNVLSALASAPPPASMADSGDERFNLSVYKVSPQTFFKGLVKDTGYNVVVHPDVTGQISLELDNVTVPEVLQIMQELYGFDYKLQGRIYQIYPEGLRTEIYHINYLNIKRMGGSETQVSSGQITNTDSRNRERSTEASDLGESDVSRLVGTRISTVSQTDFWNQLTKTLMTIIGNGPERTVVTTPNAGVVVVRASAAELRSVKEYLRRTELIMQRQVILEAKIMEVELSESYQQGISWQNFERMSSSIAEDGLPKKFWAGNQIGQQITNDNLGGVFTGVLRIGDFESVIQLLGTQGNVQVLSSPRISTVNNQKAVIKVGTDEYFVTDLDVDDQTGNISDRTSTDIELTPFFSGIALDVTPQISEDGSIILHVHPSISRVEDQEKIVTVGEQDVVLPLAFSTVRETDSVIKAKSGQIVVIGGLIQNLNLEDNGEIPGLASLPWVGELFKQRRQGNAKNELVILLKPVITGEGVWAEDIKNTRQRFDRLQSILSSPSAPSPVRE